MRKAAGLMLTTALLLGGGMTALGPVGPVFAEDVASPVAPVTPETPATPVTPVLPELPGGPGEANPPAPTFPTITKLPEIRTAQVGVPVIASFGAWDGGEEITTTIEWLVDDVAVPGETSETFVPGVEHAGSRLGLIVWLHSGELPPFPLPANAVQVSPGTLALGSVSVEGVAAVGKTLLATHAGQKPAGTHFTYQWLRNGSAIAGSATAKYTLTAADLGKVLSVRATGTHSGYAPATVTSRATSKVVAGTLGSATPTVSGSAIVGKTLTGAPGTWSTKGTTFSYQWLRNGAAITGATKSTYKLTSSDAGKKISLRVTGTNAGYNAKSSTSKATGTVLRALTATPTPTVSGTVKVGSTVSVKAGTWSPAQVGLSYQWLRDGSAITGATKTSYRLTSSDAGKKISVRVTGKKTGYASVARTSASKSVPRVLKTAAPAISGTKQVGSTLKVDRGTWTAGASLSTQWLRNGVAIKGATGASYKLTASDAGKKISVRITGTKLGYSSATRTSAQTATVTYPNRVTVSGGSCPAWAPIKGNASSMIYHVPGGAFYNRTNPEECFRTTAAAVAAGYRASKR